MYNQVLTNDGAALLRDAVNNSKKIVFTRAICGSHYDMDSRGDLAAKPKDWYNGATGSITTVTADASGLVVIASFSAVDSGTDPVKSACICAQIAKDGDDPVYDPADDVIYAAWCDDNAQYTSGDDITIKFSLPVSIVGLVDDVGGGGDDYVTLDGENQEITGSFSFPNDTGSTLSINAGSSGQILSVSDDGVDVAMVGSGKARLCSSADLSAADTTVIDVWHDGINIYPHGTDGSSEFYSLYTIPLKCEYSTSDKTVDLTTADGTKIRLTCTNVEEVSE